MLSSTFHVDIYSGVKNCIWLPVVTLVHTLPKECELRSDCIKTKTIKNYFNLFPCLFFKNI